MFGRRPPQLPVISTDVSTPRRPLLSPAIIQRGIVWGGLGAGAWVVILEVSRRPILTSEVAGVGFLSFLIAVGVLLLRGKP